MSKSHELSHRSEQREMHSFLNLRRITADCCPKGRRPIGSDAFFYSLPISIGSEALFDWHGIGLQDLIVYALRASLGLHQTKVFHLPSHGLQLR